MAAFSGAILRDEKKKGKKSHQRTPETFWQCFKMPITMTCYLFHSFISLFFHFFLPSSFPSSFLPFFCLFLPHTWVFNIQSTHSKCSVDLSIFTVLNNYPSINVLEHFDHPWKSPVSPFLLPNSLLSYCW